MTVYTMFNKDSVDQTKKVYVNPNFNRPPVTYPNNAGMHVNPKFSHILSSVQPNTQNKPRIYLNPNFMKSRIASDIQPASTITNIQQPTYINQSTLLPSKEQAIRERQILTVPLPIERQSLTVPVPISKTRYCLVRQNASKVLERPVDKPNKTIQINKYKSIALNDIKKKLDSVNNTLSIHSHTGTTVRKYSSLSLSSTSKNKFKVLNHSYGRLVVHDKIIPRTSNDTQIKMHLAKLKKIKGGLKKNNIPCPMFKKFGKCIRNKCEFLHDKKHVSICRKFLKGLCHDTGCLLSHDLTSKKMPTCYFYLQGTCTKTDCPYLHVKLSEKVKICSDFLKGYCEKGNQCLQRHIDSNKVKKVKSILSIRSFSTPIRKLNRSKDKILQQKSAQTTQTHETTVSDVTGNNLDCRYYEENKTVENESETYEIIKPLRCKLGTLPSFIQL